MEIPISVVIVKFLAAAFAGALIGLERTYHGRAAGFRTHTLVCSASAVLVLLTDYHLLPGLYGTGALNVDPLRTVQGVMTGIGFLGAGVIMREGGSIHGLTTAASIWMTAAIGIVLGSGFYSAGVMATLLTLVTLVVLRWLERLFPSTQYGNLTVHFKGDIDEVEKDLRALIRTYGGSAQTVGYGVGERDGAALFSLSVHMKRGKDFAILMQVLQNDARISSSSLTISRQ